MFKPDDQSTRRQFLAGSAKIAAATGAVAVGLTALPSIAGAQTTEECKREAARRYREGLQACGKDQRCRLDVYRQYRADLDACRVQPPPPPQENGDIDVLNYALTLEHLEANFYIQGVDAFSAFDLESYLLSQNFGTAIATTAYSRIIDIRDHEVTHVETLQNVITSLGGTPVPPCNYDFSSAFVDVATFLATTAVLENTGVSAYDGAIALIESRSLQTASATIATVEARHASYANELNGVSGFPAAFDTPVAPQEIINAVLATGFIISCPVPPPVPNQPGPATP
jgi:hypothetical protein